MAKQTMRKGEKCFNLQALQLTYNNVYDCSAFKESDTDHEWSLLTYFPSLRYCRLTGDHMYVAQYLITGVFMDTVSSH